MTRGPRPVVAALVVLLATLALGVSPSAPAAADVAGPGAVAEASAYAAGRGVEVGVAVFDRDTGRWSENGLAHTQMRSASVLKTMVAESLLDRSRRGEVQLTHDDRALLEAMVILSDDAAMSNLYSRFGGLAMIRSVTAKYGLTEIGDPPSPSYWGMFPITAHDVVRFYDGMLSGGLQPADRDYLVSLMRRATPYGSDGFYQYAGIPDALPGQVWGVKQGWTCCEEGRRKLHSTGILGADGRYLVAVLSQAPQSRSYAYLGETITRVVQVLFPGGTIPSSDRPHDPFGNVDVVDEVAPGVVRVSGWAADPDTPAGPVDVHVYLDGGWAGAVRTDGERPDVPVVHPGYSSTRGWSTDLRVGEGTHRVCAYAINIDRGTTNPQLACRDFAVMLSPVGNLDGVVLSGLRTVRLLGWAMDRESPATATDVHVYVDGRWAAATRAAADRPDVAVVFPGAGPAHGLDARVQLPSIGRHQVCAYAINVPGTGGTNPLLGCASVDAPAGILGGVDEATGSAGQTRVRGWAIDPARPGSPVQVHVYSDGGWVTAVAADQDRPDVGSVFPEAGAAHGYDVVVGLPPGLHRVCVHAIYADGRASNPELGCRTTG